MNHAEYKTAFQNADRLEREFLAYVERHKDTRRGLFEAGETDPEALSALIGQHPDNAAGFRTVLEGSRDMIADLEGYLHHYRTALAKLAAAYEGATDEALPEDVARDAQADAKREYIEAIESVESLFKVLKVYGDAEDVARDHDAMFGIGKAGLVMADKVRDSVETLIDWGSTPFPRTLWLRVLSQYLA